MDNISPEAEALIRTCITSLDQVEALILSSTAASASGVSRVDEISFFPPQASGISVGFTNGKAAGKYYASRISIILGVPLYSNAFGSGGYDGDSFFPGFGRGGRGGIIPLG